MKAVTGLLNIALCTAACSAGTPAEPKKPQIPAALHGCWEMDEPATEELNAVRQTLVVTGDKIVIESVGVGRRSGTIELVERLTPQLIDGRITAWEDGRPITLATTLEIAADDLGPGQLRLREGDAGSYVFTRCSPATEGAQLTSLVIAETGRQDDPRPAPCGPDGSCGDSLFRAEFRNARVIAGGDLQAAFDARLKLHSPLISNTTLALIVRRQADGSLQVLRRAGFDGRNGIACFREPDELKVDWKPDMPAVRWEKDTLCVLDPAQIDPNAPK